MTKVRKMTKNPKNDKKAQKKTKKFRKMTKNPTNDKIKNRSHMI